MYINMYVGCAAGEPPHDINRKRRMNKTQKSRGGMMAVRKPNGYRMDMHMCSHI